jgi:thioesterase domain-containing protein
LTEWVKFANLYIVSIKNKNTLKMPEIFTLSEQTSTQAIPSFDDEDFLLPNDNEVEKTPEDKSEIARGFADEMEALGFNSKVLEGEDNPLPDLVRSLTLIDHDTLPSEPTVRLYRGVQPTDGQQLAHQVGYLLKHPIYDEYGRVNTVELESEDVFQAVESFANNPSYRSLLEASEAASMSDNNRRFVNERIKEMRRNLIMFPNRTLLDELSSQHVAAPWGVPTQDLSPFVATSLHPNIAAGRGGNSLMILDVPLSDIAGLGEGADSGDDVLLTGSIRPEWITAVAELRHNEQMSADTLAPLVQTLGGQEITSPDTLRNTELHQKSELNHQDDLREINRDLIEEILSVPNTDSDTLRDVYTSRNIETYKDALWVTADYYLKQIQATGRWQGVESIQELYQYDDVTHFEVATSPEQPEDETGLMIDDSEPEPKELNIKEIEKLAKIVTNLATTRV